MLRNDLPKALTKVMTIKTENATDWRAIWEDLVTLYHDGLKPYFLLQKNMIDMVRIIITT